MHPDQSASSGRQVVVVQGLGFVGAAMSVAVATAKDANGQGPYDVMGLDLATDSGLARVAALNRGEFPFETSDRELVAAARAAHESGRLHATTDTAVLATADIVIVDVHLDVGGSASDPRVDFGPFEGALRTVGANVRPGTLVIVETTVPPGTCETVVEPVLRAEMEKRGLPGDSVLIAHSYERVMPGDDYLRSITHFWRVFAGITPEAGDRCEAFLRTVIDTKSFPLTRLESPRASELAKILENSYRATNIAFIEEWGRLAERIGVDLFQVIDAVRMRPTHSNIRQPGFGVGGYCLTKDPLFARVSARQIYGANDLEFPFSEKAVGVNQQMPLVSLGRLRELLGGSLAGKRILLMGISYRPDVADTRFSPAETFLRAAVGEGATVLVHDPIVKEWQETGQPVLSSPPEARTVDALLLGVPHREYVAWDVAAWIGDADVAVLDANRVLSRSQLDLLRERGCRVAVIGAGSDAPAAAQAKTRAAS